MVVSGNAGKSGGYCEDAVKDYSPPVKDAAMPTLERAYREIGRRSFV